MIRAALLALLMPGLASADPASRVITLGGAVTEIAVALGAADRLIARDTTSNYPEGVTALPDVGYIRALSVEGVLGLGPDLVIADAGAGPPEAVEALRAAGVPFAETSGEVSPEGVLEKITAVAKALDLEAEGAVLRDSVAGQLRQAEARAQAVGARKSVLFLLSLQGGRVMAGGNGTSAEGIITLAGAVNAAQGFDGWKQITDEAVIAASPDVILMMDRGGDQAVTVADVRAHPALSLTPAVEQGHILRMDGMLLLGFGPRTAKAAADLHAAIYGG
jgi:iron complex transport system substrate-binding protein